ncbi:hypothetical protein CONCODRAFT_4645 [Conidiobolus coronatus NRRL 28638]|uniref:SH3 domain-containing protein n=1 Tax=Conidiobolus coronatus (strain ATCC 28846 / CBS 209.66 / NRRL 28638) TaxID=796925 RepID=A0A137PC11_CONC2|nr:hypothetical protein CONCODRAFT_4645 [Conidiobolus coronatus NRRL 28638]|eukprot:KXN72548.1 hypothetical protein CONCODRAFT_4645 [Conidiobolus coronatus NRRL 28638]
MSKSNFKSIIWLSLFSYLLAATPPTVSYMDCSPVYKYKSVHFQGCTEADSEGMPWCMLKKPANNGSPWGYCNMTTLPVFTGNPPDNTAQVQDCDVTHQMTPPNLKKSITYYGCYSTDNQKTYHCQSNGALINCLVGLSPTSNEYRKPPPNLLPNTTIPHPTNITKEGEVDSSMLSEDRSSSGSNSVLIIVLSCLAAAVIVAIIGYVMVKRHRRRWIREHLKAAHYISHDYNNMATTKSVKSPPPVMTQFSAAPSYTQINDTHNATNNVSKNTSYTVVSTYTPTLSDELVIQPGDQVTVITEFDDGWCQGVNVTRGGCQGVFPKHCITPTAAAMQNQANQLKKSQRSSSNLLGGTQRGGR